MRAGRDLYESLLRSDGLRRSLVTQNPSFAAALLGSNGYQERTFRSLYIRDAMSRPDSMLMAELQAPRPMVSPVGFDFDASPLLSAMIADPQRAKVLGIWKPMGDDIIRRIIHDTEYRTGLNAPPPPDGDLERDPTFCGLRFFEMMVAQAARRDAGDDMWLRYLLHIVRALADVHRGKPGQVDDDEFPTLGLRLIYEALARFREWIDFSVHLTRRKDSVGVDDIIIPSAAARAFGSSISPIVSDQSLPARFRADAWESFVKTLVDLGPTDIASLRALMLNALLDGDTVALVGAVEELESRVDTYLLCEAEDLRERLDRLEPSAA